MGVVSCFMLLRSAWISKLVKKNKHTMRAERKRIVQDSESSHTQKESEYDWQS